MRLITVLFSLALLIACSSNEQKAETKSPIKRDEKLCFLLTEGLKNEDSTSLQIHIQDTLVTGYYSIIPYEKDASIGSISGTIKDSIIECVYSYTQEGIDSKENQIWKLQNDKILLKTAPGTYDEQGNIVYDSSQFEFNFILYKVDCDPSKQVQ
ncbi:MAG: hypothetical protein ACOVP1_00995 [Bacteroidia bacterium]